MTVTFSLNGKATEFSGDESMPLLWFLRDHAGLTGTKFGCGIAQCGACTVHVDGSATRSCVLPMSAVAGRSITTIEGLASPTANERGLHVVQRAWIEEDVPQCGYCQAGQIMAAADLLRRAPHPSDEDIAGLTNLCRCGTYPRIRKAIHRAATLMDEERSA
ncbi:MAG: (2Fe-2S)-binding protein [Xanthomonadales bacterium]|nr:(2Fe-2S)-binding protein [Xanthomonadales bacterium]